MVANTVFCYAIIFVFLSFYRLSVGVEALAYFLCFFRLFRHTYVPFFLHMYRCCTRHVHSTVFSCRVRSFWFTCRVSKSVFDVPDLFIARVTLVSSEVLNTRFYHYFTCQPCSCRPWRIHVCGRFFLVACAMPFTVFAVYFTSVKWATW